MGQIGRPKVRDPWADKAARIDNVDPGEALSAAGFPPSSVPPARQFLNWILNYCSAGIRYLSRRGTADYDPTETYLKHDIVLASDGVLYQSIQDGNTSNLPGSLSDWWGPAALHPRTPSEEGAGASAIALGYPAFPFADVRRYGCKCDGKSDDTAALQAALSAASQLGIAIMIPAGYSLRITGYVQLFSNTSLHILGKLKVTGRSAGLYANGASNIGIYGHKIGVIQDSDVLSFYRWNMFTTLSPCIHIRSSKHVLIDGLHLNHVQQGILISNATLNSSNAAAWQLTQESPLNCQVSNCSAEFCEAAGIAMYSGVDCAFKDNYVYRCGDGGLWMMGCIDCDVVGNHRVSPKATPLDVAQYGANNPLHDTTWNDEQGMEFEACLNLLIQGNLIKNFWAASIDIKTNCNRVLCSGNRVVDAENGSIVVREGDPGDVAACMKISIIGNTISGHGTPHFNIPTPGISGAISLSSCFITEVINNVIYAFQHTAGIHCLGPGAYMTDYPANPHQAALTVTGNTVDFKNTASEDEKEFMFSGATRSAIFINGQYDSVLCSGNHIKTDRYLTVDSRLNKSAAISLSYVSANNSFYPTTASISGNAISNWGYHAIEVNGLHSAVHSGLIIGGNAIGNPGGNGILLNFTRSAICSNNNINQAGSGAGYAAIVVTGAAGKEVDGVICMGNVLTGRYDGGLNAMTFGLSFNYCSGVIASNNVINNASRATIEVSNGAGDHIFTGSTGFPRSGSRPPDGEQTSYYKGELYFDVSSAKWWAASAPGQSVWTQLSS